jgi:lysophospholipase L1-like esterase
MRRPRLRTIALAAAALALLAEIALRLFSPTTQALYDSVVVTRTRFKMRPETRIEAPERYGDIAYAFNSLGYRDREHPDDGRERIELLGDSVTFGLGVAQDRIFGARLQQLLDARWPRRFDVANLAIFAYNTENELDTLREDGLRLRPRIVVVELYMNDFSTPLPGARVPPPTFGNRFAAARNKLFSSSLLFLRAQQFFGRLQFLLLHDARRRWFPNTLNAAEPKDKLAFLATHPADSQVGAFVRLQEIAALSARQGAHMLLLVSPDESQLREPRFDAIDGRIVAFGARNDIPVLDLLPLMRRNMAHDLFLDGVHLTARGHAVVATALAAELDRRGWLGAAAVPATSTAAAH